MSVIVKNIDNKDNIYKVYTKGSPEKLMPLCNKSTIPYNYDKILSEYTSKGLRVLAIGCKIVSLKDLTSYSREDAEKDLIFLGFYIVQNKLKKETTKEIEILQNADIQISMATGDNILTASFIAQESGIVKTDIMTIELQNNGDIQVNKLIRQKRCEVGNNMIDSSKSISNINILLF